MTWGNPFTSACVILEAIAFGLYTFIKPNSIQVGTLRKTWINAEYNDLQIHFNLDSIATNTG